MQDADAGQTGRGWGGGIFNVIDHRKWYPEKKNLDFFTEAPSPLRGGLFFTCPKGTRFITPSGRFAIYALSRSVQLCWTQWK
jgi:hypothetical protein